MVGEYAALAVLAMVSAVGFPGPGDSALIAGGLLAADGDLSLAVVLITAFFSALVGRALGYWLGSVGGRPLVQRPGPLHGFRLRTLEKGDDLFQRFTRFAPLLAPAVLSGIYQVPRRVFGVMSVLAATSWTLSTRTWRLLPRPSGGGHPQRPRGKGHGRDCDRRCSRAARPVSVAAAQPAARRVRGAHQVMSAASPAHSCFLVESET